MNRRRRIIINKIQIQLIITIIGLVISVSAILIVLLFHLFDINMAKMGAALNTRTDVIMLTIVPIIISALIIYIITIWATLFITYKIYGPLHRLSNYIKKLSQGEKTGEISFRKGDAINGIREMYNKLMRNLEKTLNYDYQEMSKIYGDLENILDEINSKKLDNQQISERLQKITSRLATALDLTSETIEKQQQ